MWVLCVLPALRLAGAATTVPHTAWHTLTAAAAAAARTRTWVQALVLEAEEKLEAQGGSHDRASLAAAATTFYEVTIASIDQPKLLSRLSESLVRVPAAAAAAAIPAAAAVLLLRGRMGVHPRRILTCTCSAAVGLL